VSPRSGTQIAHDEAQCAIHLRRPGAVPTYNTTPTTIRAVPGLPCSRTHTVRTSTSCLENDSELCYLDSSISTLDCHRLELSLPLYHLENLQNYYIDHSCTGVCTKWKRTPGVVPTFTQHWTVTAWSCPCLCTTWKTCKTTTLTSRALEFAPNGSGLQELSLPSHHTTQKLHHSSCP